MKERINYLSKLIGAGAAVAISPATPSAPSVNHPISDIAYASSWDGSTTNAPSKNAVYDKMEVILAELGFFNGTFLENFDAVVTSDGATITMSLEKTGTGDLTMVFSDEHTALDCTPALTIALTAGSDASPQGNWIYILQSDKILTKSTTAWPTAEHIKIGLFHVPSATFVAAANKGVYMNQNWNEMVGGDANAQGHLTHIGRRIRQSGALYFSGIDGNGTTDYLTLTAGNAYFKSTAGVVQQMHPHTFTAQDTSGVDFVLVVNQNGAAYDDVQNLYTGIPNDSTGAALGNNKYFTLVFWGVANKTGETEFIMCNLPGGTYNTLPQAKQDELEYTVFTMPREFSIDSSTGFLICKVVLKKTATAWEHQETTDLRGQTPQTARGATGVNITEFPANTFRVFDPTDPTKEIDFDASGITTANTRTITMDDADVDLGLINDYLDQAVKTTSSPTFVSPVVGTSLLPDASGGADIGSATLEFGDMYLADNKNVNFGSDQDAKIGHSGASFLLQNNVGQLKIASLSGSATLLSSRVGITLDIDANNNSTNDVFKVTKDNEGTILLTVIEEGSLKIQQLGAAPATLANGTFWMENDGLHIYYNGAEKIVAGV